MSLGEKDLNGFGEPHRPGDDRSKGKADQYRLHDRVGAEIHAPWAEIARQRGRGHDIVLRERRHGHDEPCYQRGTAQHLRPTDAGLELVPCAFPKVPSRPDSFHHHLPRRHSSTKRRSAPTRPRQMLRLRREEPHSDAYQLRQIFGAKLPLKVEAGIDHGLVADAELLGDTAIRFAFRQ